jgi:integrase
VLDAAKRSASRHPKGRLCNPRLTIEQAKRRFFYVVGEKLGVTKNELGVTVHGLRHEYANDLYGRVSGSPSTVRGGSIVDRAADEKARHEVSQHLGHARLSITASYTGSRARGRPRSNATETTDALCHGLKNDEEVDSE